MDTGNPHPLDVTSEDLGQQPLIVMAEVVSAPPRQEMPGGQPSPRRRRFWLPLALFIATCLSTLWAGGFESGWVAFHRIMAEWQVGGREGGAVGALAAALAGGLSAGFFGGLRYALPLMTILICHEMGHFLQARRYGVYASYPYFIPMPFSFIGTFGAVIAMESHRGDRRALFDIGVTGPIAGLAPTVLFILIGLSWSRVDRIPAASNVPHFGVPLLLEWICQWRFGELPPGFDIYLHPMAFAGWVGLLITSLNLMPIGQLDGGHVLYALLRHKALPVASALLMAALVAVVFFGIRGYEVFGWIPMLLLLIFVVGPDHPPTAKDDMPLGLARTVIGWLVLAFIPIGFTPVPIVLGS